MFKKLIWPALLLLVFIVCTGIAHADPERTLFQNATSVGYSDFNVVRTAETSSHTVFCNFSTSGTVTALVIDLDGSIDNDLYENLAQHTFSAGEISSETAMYHVNDKYVSSVRSQISTLTDSGNTFVDCKYKRGK